MRYFLYVVYLLLASSSAIRMGCLQNATFSGISFGIWLNDSINCHFCACYMLTMNFSAFNCYMKAVNTSNCLLFRNYSSVTGGIQLATGQNGSSACFMQFPPESSNPTSSYRSHTLISDALAATSMPTTMGDLAISTAQPLCGEHTLSTILLQLYNAPGQSYTQYSYVYQATSTKTTLMFCFLNEQNFWALDNVTMIDYNTNVNKMKDSGFESGSWSHWTPYNTIYYASGLSTGYNSWSPLEGSYFYLDVQYAIPDGIFQNVTTVVGRNYTISFYLANPSGGNFSVAVISVGS